MSSTEVTPRYAVWMFLGAYLIFVLSLLPTGWWSWPIAAFSLIVIYYGSHEAAHDAIYASRQSRRASRVINLVSGVFGSALMGQNFLFIRWDHQTHHARDRALHLNSVDGKYIAPGARGYIQYYAELLGFEALYNECLCYAYAVNPRLQTQRSKQFPIKRIGVRTFRLVQLSVLAINLALLALGGWKFIAARIAFIIYWGLSQNVAHYGMRVDEAPYEFIAARTYRINPVLSTLFFGSFHRHIEHHAFPRVSGLNLGDPALAARFADRWKIHPVPRGGLGAYLVDALRQFQGPHYRETTTTSWWEPVE